MYRKGKVEAGFEEAGVTTIKINEIVDEAYIHYLVWNTDSGVRTLEKFSYNKRVIWEVTVINWLQTKRVVTNLPLSYVIFKDTTPLTMDHSEFIIYNASLDTAVFKYYRREVINLLTALILVTGTF